jgi:hypothetical protein
MQTKGLIRFILLCCTLVFNSLGLQALVLKGIVTNTTLAPIANVNLKLVGADTEQAVVTKNYGVYSFELKKNTEYKIVVTNADYQTRIVLFNTNNVSDEIMNGDYTYNIVLNTLSEGAGIAVVYSRHKNFPEMVHIKPEIVTPIAIITPQVITNKKDSVLNTTLNNSGITSTTIIKNEAVSNAIKADTTQNSTANIKNASQGIASKLESIKSVTRINSAMASNAYDLQNYLMSVNDKVENNYKNKIQKQIGRNKQIIDESSNPITTLYANIANFEKNAHQRKR